MILFEEEAMQFSDYIAIIALAISAITGAVTIWDKLRNRARIKTQSEFLPAQQDEEGPTGPPTLSVVVRNHGQRAVYLENLYVQYGANGGARIAETLWQSDEHGLARFGEGIKHKHFFEPDTDSILKDDDGTQATNLFFTDSYGNRYYVKNAKRNLQAYFAATSEM